MLNLPALRRLELGRRVASLPDEITEWRARTEKPPTTDPQQIEAEQQRVLKFQERFVGAHFSQILALQTMVQAMVSEQRILLDGMNPGGPAPEFTKGALSLLTRTVLAQQFWDYFRDKFELRFSPKFGEALWIADTVAYDCYAPIMQRAVELGIVEQKEFREPPLTYLNAETSPLTWLRSQVPMQDGVPVFGSGKLKLPFAVIELPWEQMENLWELLALHHEVGHDLERDLGIELATARSLKETLVAAGADEKSVRIWGKWCKEIFADLVALQLGGPAFAASLASLVLFPDSMVKKASPSDPHPTHYLRIRLCAEAIRGLGAQTRLEGNQRLTQFLDAAQELDDAWTQVYGPDPGIELAPLFAHFTPVIQALLDTPWVELKNHTVRQLIPYLKEEDDLVLRAAEFFAGGPNHPGPIKPRLVISAGHRAVSKAVSGGIPTTPDQIPVLKATIDTINNRILSFVTTNAPPGLRAGGNKDQRKQSLQTLASDLLQQTFRFQGESL